MSTANSCSSVNTTALSKNCSSWLASPQNGVSRTPPADTPPVNRTNPPKTKTKLNTAMARKKKDATIEPETPASPDPTAAAAEDQQPDQDTTAAPAGEAVAEAPEAQPDPEPVPPARYYRIPEWMPEPPRTFPFALARRIISVERPPDDAALAGLSKEQAEVAFEIRRLEDEKKAYAAKMKAELDGLHSRLLDLAHQVQDGVNHQVECETVYEVAGFEGGAWIVNSRKKCIVSMKTGEVIKVEDMTEADNITDLPLIDAPAMGETPAFSLMTVDELQMRLDAGPYGIMPDERDEAEHAWYAHIKDNDEAPMIPLVGVTDRASAMQAALSLPIPDGAAEIGEPDPAPSEPLDEAYFKGAEDRRLNLPRARCPFPETDPAYGAWLKGWDAEDERIEQAANDDGGEASDPDPDAGIDFDSTTPPPDEYFAAGHAEQAAAQQ